jgi:DNA invertase Pin-like site-specific DNA recombinase
MAQPPNLQRRPAKPALGNGRIQRAVRQAFYFGSEVTSSDVYDWVYPRRRHFLSQAHRHSVRRVLMMMADPVERAPTIGRPWLWRLRNGGEARVSTRDQDLAAQDAELMAAGCAKVFKEKVSGAKTDRPELAKVIGRLEPGDVLVVTRLDRLARSTRDLLNVIAAISERGAGFRSLKDTWADTTTPHGRLMLTVLGGLAEFERELIRSRTGEGRARAKERGVRFGRPRKMTPHQHQEALQRLAAGETMADVARTYNVDATTIGRLLGDRPFLGDASGVALQGNSPPLTS